MGPQLALGLALRFSYGAPAQPRPSTSNEVLGRSSASTSLAHSLAGWPGGWAGGVAWQVEPGAWNAGVGLRVQVRRWVSGRCQNFDTFACSLRPGLTGWPGGWAGGVARRVGCPGGWRGGLAGGLTGWLPRMPRTLRVFRRRLSLYAAAESLRSQARLARLLAK